jgi:hypothetical protein
VITTHIQFSSAYVFPTSLLVLKSPAKSTGKIAHDAESEKGCFEGEDTLAFHNCSCNNAYVHSGATFSGTQRCSQKDVLLLSIDKNLKLVRIGRT